MREEPFSRRLKEEADRELFRGLEFGEEMKERVRRRIKEKAPPRASRRTWLWALPALGAAAAIFAGVLVLRPGETPRGPSSASAPERKAPLALAPPAAEQQPATEEAEGAASPRPAREAPAERLAEAPADRDYRAVEVAGARVTIGPPLTNGPGRLQLPVRVEVAGALERSASLLDPQRWGFSLVRETPGEGSPSRVSLRPEGVTRGPGYWEGVLPLPPEREKEDLPLRLEVTWEGEAREIRWP